MIYLPIGTYFIILCCMSVYHIAISETNVHTTKRLKINLKFLDDKIKNNNAIKDNT